MPRVSVVIPVYNSSDTLPRALTSALSQTYDDIEIIVIDDGSIDDTEEVMASFDDRRIRFFQHEKNRGGSAARNTGIEHATGEYIAFLDADDEWFPSKVERQVNVLESRSDQWIATYSNFKQKRSNVIIEFIDKYISRPTGFEGDDIIIDNILRRTFSHGGTSSLLVKKSAINLIDGFDEMFQRHQDLEFILRLLQVGKMAFTDEILFKKYDTGSPEGDSVAEAIDQFYDKFLDLIRERGMEEEAKGVLRYIKAKQYLSSGQFREGFAYLWSSSIPHKRDILGVGFAIFRGVRTHLDRLS
ncbi:glycosyltransferase family 2 protein [Halorubrum sp. CBA1229]|uniref:glycosyltransferase family 2 protein n=1 Tax=Halorubrum sp. CBA1229 TaxID=1853699 RepID=UPI000F3C2589|nr:glycosyltransferase family 2 protein [Halorubrum sp. CBA1229]QKY15578.1 glycosyltransferase family 2 protein [Halorubrum sp. CBA1229]